MGEGKGEKWKKKIENKMGETPLLAKPTKARFDLCG